jgi:hypothetical protein
MSYEYRVIPAPTKGTKAKGAKTAEERFALTLQETMNSMAADGWQFQRAETLPSEERAGLTGRKTVYHNMLVFRRESRSGLEAFQPRVVTGEATGEAPRALRAPLSALSEPSGKAPPVLSPLSLSGTLSKGNGEPRD